MQGNSEDCVVLARVPMSIETWKLETPLHDPEKNDNYHRNLSRNRTSRNCFATAKSEDRKTIRLPPLENAILIGAAVLRMRGENFKLSIIISNGIIIANVSGCEWKYKRAEKSPHSYVDPHYRGKTKSIKRSHAIGNARQEEKPQRPSWLDCIGSSSGR